MSLNDTSSDRPPVVLGAIGGLAAWILGYAVVFLAAGTDVQDSAAQRFLEAVGGEPATYEMVGWVFYNAHFVDVVAEVPVIGSFTTNAVGGEDGLTAALYLVPVVVLLGAGLAVGWSQGIDDPISGGTAGLTLVPGYLALTLVGLFLFEVSIGDATASPQLFEGAVIAGLVYPTVFGGVGGVTASVLS